MLVILDEAKGRRGKRLWKESKKKASGHTFLMPRETSHVLIHKLHSSTHLVIIVHWLAWSTTLRFLTPNILLLNPLIYIY